MKSSARLLAIGGLVGPAAFIGAWTAAGVQTPGYSPINDAISDLAAFDASTRGLMTAGFIVDGLGLIAFGLALRETLDGKAWMAAVTTGAATLGVAATPLGGWSGDTAHAMCAGIGYVSITAVPLLAGITLARRSHTGWRRAATLASAISAVALVASTLGPAHGLWQRLGLTVGDAWIIAFAGRLIFGTVGERR